MQAVSLDCTMADDGLIHNISEFHAPKGGTWYFRQEQMLDEFEAQKGQVFPVAWDKYEGRGNKIYGIYETVDTFYSHLADVESRYRCGYELIPHESNCKFYADIEWEGDQDTDHSIMRSLVKGIRRYCAPLLATHQAMELYISCSSRSNQRKGTYKNSYHVSSPTIVFGNNHDGRMEKFFTDMCNKDQDLWYYTDEESQRKKCFLDLRVYTTNRCIRLPLCCKLGANVPFVRISGNPFDNDDSLTSSFNADNPLAWLPFVLTNPDCDLASVVVASAAETPDLAVRGKRRRVVTDSSGSSDDLRLHIEKRFLWFFCLWHDLTDFVHTDNECEHDQKHKQNDFRFRLKLFRLFCKTEATVFPNSSSQNGLRMIRETHVGKFNATKTDARDRAYTTTSSNTAATTAFCSSNQSRARNLPCTTIACPSDAEEAKSAWDYSTLTIILANGHTLMPRPPTANLQRSQKSSSTHETQTPKTTSTTT